MNYEIVYGDRALEPLFDLNMPEVLDCVDRSMNRLADDPLQHSRKGTFPYPKQDGGVFFGQMFDFYCTGNSGRRVQFRAHFFFKEDEHTLRVFDVVPSPCGLAGP